MISSTDRKGEDTLWTRLLSSSAKMKRAQPAMVQTVPTLLSSMSRLKTSRFGLVRSSDSKNFFMPAAHSEARGLGILSFLCLSTTVLMSALWNLTRMGAGRTRPWGSLTGLPAKWADTKRLSNLGMESMAFLALAAVRTGLRSRS